MACYPSTVRDATPHIRIEVTQRTRAPIRCSIGRGAASTRACPSCSAAAGLERARPSSSAARPSGAFTARGCRRSRARQRRRCSFRTANAPRRSPRSSRLYDAFVRRRLDRVRHHHRLRRRASSATSPDSPRPRSCAASGSFRCRRRSSRRWTARSAARSASTWPPGKNLAGAFHPPALVVCDPDVLSTLPRREFRAGLYEVVKYGVIASRPLFDQVAANAATRSSRTTRDLLAARHRRLLPHQGRRRRRATSAKPVRAAC